MAGSRAVSEAGRSPGDHLCWPFRRPEELVAAAQTYAAEGLARNERVVGYLPEEHLPDLRQQLSGHSRFRAPINRAQLELRPSDTSPDAGRINPARELASWAAQMRESLDAGFTGLRAFGDMTGRVTDPGQRANYVRFEHLADRFCLDHPYTALCAYNASELNDDVVAELACVHRLVHGQLPPFQLHAISQADTALAGSVDTFTAPQLIQTLRRTGLLQDGKRVVIDAGDLEFIDHRALLTLDQYTLTERATVVLRSPPAIVPHLRDLIPLQAVRLENSP